MPRVPIPLSSAVYQNVDESVVRDDHASGTNFVTDEKGGVSRRPGLRYLTAGSTGVAKGLFYSTDRAIYYVLNSTLYKVSSTLLDGSFTPTTTATTSPLASAVTINGSAPMVTFAYDGTYVFIADGGQLLYWNGSSASPLTRIATAPANSTHVVFMDGRIIVNQSGTGKFYYSDFLASLTWDALSFELVNGYADNLYGMYTYDRKLFFFGTETVEIWESDGESPFSRIPGGFYPRGIPSPYSVAMTKSGPIWIDQNNRVCLWDNGVKELPGPFDRPTSRLSSVIYGPTYASTIKYYGREMALFHYGSANRTFVFDFNSTKPEWYEWGAYDSQYGPTGFPVIGAVSTLGYGQTIVQMGDRNGLYTLDPTYYVDDPDPDPIRLNRVSGAIDFGTSARKRSNGMMLRVKRGADENGVRASGGAEPVLIIRHKDDGGNWSNEYRVGLGYQGERELIARVPTRGIFRTRQYEITATDSVPIVYSFAEEDIEVLTS